MCSLYFKKDNKILQDSVWNIFFINLFNYIVIYSIMCISAIYEMQVVM